MADLARRIAENLAEVRHRIAEAAAASGRNADQVTLVAVTKYVGEAEIRALAASGCNLLGENRPQLLWQKALALKDLPIRWHMIGHLQRNKVRRTLPLVEMIESVDSLRLIEAINREAAALERPMPILLEVNVSGEAAKHGFQPGEIPDVVEHVAGCRHVEARGLMCMASFSGGLDAARREFAALRQLRDRLRGSCPPEVCLTELSMGMSGDYEVAIREGATLVRIGSALYEGV